MQRKRRAMLRRRARAKCERARPKRGQTSERMQTTRPPHSAMQAMQNGHEQKKAPAVGFETWTTASARRGLATRDKQDSCIEHTHLAI